MRSLTLIGMVVGCSVMSLPVFGASICTSGNLSGLIGTTCDIGSLEFTFTGFDGQYFSNVGGIVTIHNWNSGDFIFSPNANGFTLSFDGGAQSIAAPAGGDIADDFADINYNLDVLGGTLTGVDVAGGQLSATGVFSAAFYQTNVCSSFGCGSSEMQAFQNTSGHIIRTGSPFASGSSNGNSIFELQASSGSATAAWDGAPTTFIFSTASTTPEPASLWLVACGGIAMLVGRTIRSLWPTDGL